MTAVPRPIAPLPRSSAPNPVVRTFGELVLIDARGKAADRRPAMPSMPLVHGSSIVATVASGTVLSLHVARDSVIRAEPGSAAILLILPVTVFEPWVTRQFRPDVSIPTSHLLISSGVAAVVEDIADTDARSTEEDGIGAMLTNLIQRRHQRDDLR
jgi:hypothetical protein